MRKLLTGMACLAFVFGAGMLGAQTTGTSTLSSKDASKTDAHDRPIGGVNIKLPPPAASTNPPSEPPPPPPAPPAPTPPSEGEDLPPVETPPDPPPPEDPPTYYGEPVQGKFVFVLDASGSMYGSRIATLRAETTATIGDLTEDDEFDVAAYGGQFPSTQDYTKFMWGTLLPGTDGNKSSAVSWVNGPSTNPGGMTPSYACLKKCCQVYPADLDKFFFITDGYPNITGSSSQILADFPGWWSKFTDCELIAVCIGGGGASFMQQLAALAGGSYVAA
ncbi:MAG: hypothetical protein ICCCNLDF_00159 [Planctomycetes bacterium]|nr:hypothetical protein [Planctomycetota bacterium]